MKTVEAIFSNLGSHLHLRPQTPKDREFLLSLYASTREEELALSGMTEQAKRAFAAQQFEAREADYARRFGDGAFLIVCRKKQPVGRVVFRVDDTVHLVDIALVKKSRGSGFGTLLLHALMEHARTLKKGFTLSVAMHNPRAIALYRKLGLTVVAQEAYYFRMYAITQ